MEELLKELRELCTYMTDIREPMFEHSNNVDFAKYEFDGINDTLLEIIDTYEIR